ncbi:TetR/AcrR family transcriptional regulator [Granulicella cerasi]|uniref:TetR/AcrR family transcriptional regulator n=1 Tax=Granulicella cerasi TaxID=741063 RepID=A0ABW1Z5X7_9BACT|nr:TetR/AcrR family transcriptional regulator [Granulicella cerasi]
MARESGREKILRGAMRVFLEDGYDAASMDRVAEMSGVARRTLYNQFPAGKESMFLAAVEEFWKGFPQLSWEDSGEVEATLRYVADAIVRFWTAEDMVPYLRMAIAVSERFPGLVVRPGDGGKLPLMEQLMQWLKKMHRARRMRVPNAELAMWQLFGLVTEPLVWPRLIGIELPTGEAFRKAVVDGAVAAMMRLYAV